MAERLRSLLSIPFQLRVRRRATTTSTEVWTPPITSSGATIQHLSETILATLHGGRASALTAVMDRSMRWSQNQMHFYYSLLLSSACVAVIGSHDSAVPGCTRARSLRVFGPPPISSLPNCPERYRVPASLPYF